MAGLAQNIKKLTLKLSPGTLLILEIENARVKHVSGKQNKRFQEDCEDIARENGLKSGLIYVVKKPGGGSQVKSSGQIPDYMTQRLRNVWSFYS